MLNFDSEHISADFSNIKDKLKKASKNITTGVLISSLMLFSGCGKTIDCSIKKPHAHQYISKDGFVVYRMSEYEKIGEYYRYDKYIDVDKNADKYYSVLQKNNLINYNDNKERFEKIISTHEDYMEYEYSYYYMKAIPQPRNNRIDFIYVPEVHYSWTKDQNKSNLTGKTRICHYQYEAYKVGYDSKGNYTLISSGLVDDLDSIVDRYPLVKKKFYKLVNLSDKKEIDYGDLENDDIKNIVEDESQINDISVDYNKSK